MNALTENKPRAHYVDNAKFYEALVQYRAACEAHEGWPETYPQVPNFIGESIVAIATNLAYRPNFNGYSWRDEMIGDAIENCLRYVKSFDIDNYKNPHAYFT